MQNRETQTNEDQSGGKWNTRVYFLHCFVITEGHLGKQKGSRCKTSKRKCVFPAWPIEHLLMRQQHSQELSMTQKGIEHLHGWDHAKLQAYKLWTNLKIWKGWKPPASGYLPDLKWNKKEASSLGTACETSSLLLLKATLSYNPIKRLFFLVVAYIYCQQSYVVCAGCPLICTFLGTFGQF